MREQGCPAALIIGYLYLRIGTFIVGFHWKWEGLPLLLTLIGVKAIAGLLAIITAFVGLSDWWQHMQ